MNKRLITIAIIVCLASMIAFDTVNAQVVTTGVTPGQSFKYKVTSHWSSSDSYSAVPQGLLDINNTDYVEVRISNVNSTSVDTFTATYFTNGTGPATERVDINVQTGISTYLQSGGSLGFVAIIGANLNAGQRIHPAGSDAITINSTSSRTYEGGPRQTNEINISVRNDTAGATSSVDRFFDQATGMLVSSTETNQIDSPASSNSVTWRIIESNAWAIPEFPLVLTLPIVMLAASIALLAYKKKHTNFIKI